MGPTNVALVKYFQADQELREAKARLDAASKDVRVQERRANDAAEKQKAAHQRLRESQTKASSLELDLKSRDAHIEKLRTQQQNAKNNKEYQTFLVEINTQKLDRNKVEEETMKLLEAVERTNKEMQEITALVESERGKLATLKEQSGGRLAEFQTEVDAVQPKREEAGKAVPQKQREAFDKLADRLDGEAMSAIAKPDRRREEYVCTACNMDLVVDVYNKLHARDEIVYCPSCRRMLYIPDDLPPEVAIKAKASLKRDADAEAPVKGARAPRAVKPRSSARKTTGNAVLDELTRLLMKAQGESVRNAMAAGNDPVEFVISLDGRKVGTFKGQNADNLARTARFCLQEAGIPGQLALVEKSVAEAQAAQVAAQKASASAPTTSTASTTSTTRPTPTTVEAPVGEAPADPNAETIESEAVVADNPDASPSDGSPADGSTAEENSTSSATQS